MVPVLLEPGERVFPGPLSTAHAGALLQMNRAYPRFAGGGWTVPGSGSGDRVPAWVPSQSFVLNRHAAGAMRLQGGGTTGGNGPPPLHGSPRAPEAEPKVVHIHLDLRSAHFKSPADAKEIIKLIEDHMRKRGDSRL